MKYLTKEFERLIIEHSRAGACWWLGCTTCGQMVTRGLFRRLDKLPDDLSDLDPRKVPFERHAAPDELFIEAASHCDMERLNKEAKFPDWLGLLGVILTEKIEPKAYATLTKRWGESLSKLNVPLFTEKWESKSKTFDWQDLELIEKSIARRHEDAFFEKRRIEREQEIREAREAYRAKQDNNE